MNFLEISFHENSHETYVGKYIEFKSIDDENVYSE